MIVRRGFGRRIGCFEGLESRVSCIRRFEVGFDPRAGCLARTVV